jgi:hypothetical protein
MFAHWLVVGQAGVPLAPGQQTQTHALDPLTVTVVALFEACPDPVTIPGSPVPVSPAVSCQGVGPSTKVALAVAERSTAPAATHMVCVAALDGAAPPTETEHHVRKFLTVNETGVAPAQPPVPPLLVPELALLLLEPEQLTAKPAITAMGCKTHLSIHGKMPPSN